MKEEICLPEAPAPSRPYNSPADWLLRPAGKQESFVVEAPVTIPGWQHKPWIRLRALTEAETLERESLGLVEEYELVSTGWEAPAVRVRRRYDLRQMAEYDYAHCVIEGCLPQYREDGTIQECWIRGDIYAEATAEPADEAAGASRREYILATELLERMPPALAAWLHTEIERINFRLPEQRAIVEAAKKD